MAFIPLTVPPDHVEGDVRWYPVRDTEVLVADGTQPDPDDLATDTEAVFLGVTGRTACWAQGVAPSVAAPAGTRWVSLRALGAEVDPEEWSVAGRAVQLVEWRRTSRFCGRCGTATAPVEGDRAVRCPACGLSAYPRLAPAVIVLVHREGEVLLARNAQFRGRMFSTLAGFVEPGETLEQAVRREVREEVGVRLGEVRYFGSQPWPFPHSLMVGFVAEWAGGDIVIDGLEIAEAAWWRRQTLPEVPSRTSIARQMIDAWVAGSVGGSGGA